MKTKSKLSDPGIILVSILLIIAATVFIWWPKDIHWMGISLVGWLMFFCFFIWFALTIIYVIWVEKKEKE